MVLGGLPQMGVAGGRSAGGETEARTRGASLGLHGRVEQSGALRLALTPSLMPTLQSDARPRGSGLAALPWPQALCREGPLPGCALSPASSRQCLP